MKKVVKKAAPKKAAPKKKVAPVKGAWVPPWAKKEVKEKKTGEKYASKAEMAKHEKGESKKMRMMEGEIPMAKKGSKVPKMQYGGTKTYTGTKGKTTTTRSIPNITTHKGKKGSTEVVNYYSDNGKVVRHSGSKGKTVSDSSKNFKAKEHESSKGKTRVFEDKTGKTVNYFSKKKGLNYFKNTDSKGVTTYKKGGKAKKSCSCEKTSCMMCGGKHKMEKKGKVKKYQDGGRNALRSPDREEAPKPTEAVFNANNAATADSTNYYKGKSMYLNDAVNANLKAGNIKGSISALKARNKANNDRLRQQNKGKSGYDSNGFPAKVMSRGGKVTKMKKVASVTKMRRGGKC